MADFVAVIRKAVDGLANNTPETRSKVYEKARSAVVRQLENMKPRPPEELLNRQIAKLDAAIAEVESEYAEALPALEDDEDDFLHEQEAPYYEEKTSEPEPEQESPVQEPQPEEPAVYYADHAEPQGYEAEQYEDVVDTPPQTHVYEAEPADEPEQEHAHALWVGADSPEAQEWKAPAEQPAEELAPEHEAEYYAGQWTQHSATDDSAPAETFEAEAPYDSGYTSPQQYDQDVSVQISEPRFDTIADDRRALDAAADDIFGSPDAHQSNEAPRDFTALQDEPIQDEPRRDDGIDFGTAAGAGAVIGASTGAAAGTGDEFKRYFDDAIDTAPQANMPRTDNDPFAQQTEGGKRDAWDDLEDLIGYDSRGNGTGKSAGDEASLDTDTGSVIPPNVYVKPKKNRTKEILIGAAAVLVIAGGAYALYENRSALNDVVGGLTEQAQTEAQPAATDAAANGAANNGTAQGVPLPSNGNGADNGETTGTKFTQRLLTDGTEKDEGPALASNNQPATAEGVSQSEKNEEAPAPAVEAPTTSAQPAPTSSEPAPTAATPAVAVAGERMFLYEEVLGQSAPSAIAGTVAWSLVNEQDPSGKSVPTVQAQLNVPERGITALMTFKKNSDASLPASHIVEIVFSTGAGFEGGAIDSVQRIAMKATEQDRGNALIAVPAKITDDFHMIALNDFPDARATNLNLLSSRDWLDIPLAYRNGRRALLTLQKGPAGKQAFETALREWQAQ